MDFTFFSWKSTDQNDTTILKKNTFQICTQKYITRKLFKQNPLIKTTNMDILETISAAFKTVNQIIS